MAEKEKPRVHPFAPYIRSNEQVLWVSDLPELSPWQQAKRAWGRYGALAVSIIVCILLGITIGAGKRRLELLYPFVFGLGLIILVALLLLLIQSVRWSRRGKYQEPFPKRLYGLTNERLLYYLNGDISTRRLEEIPIVTLTEGDGFMGTLTFANQFPAWPDVNDAARVKRLIDDARKKRMQRL